MDYPGDFCYGVSLHIGGAFMAKIFYEIVTILWIVFADQNFLLFWRYFRCRAVWGELAAHYALSDGGFDFGCPWSESGTVPQTCGLPEGIGAFEKQYACSQVFVGDFLLLHFVKDKPKFACLLNASVCT